MMPRNEAMDAIIRRPRKGVRLVSDGQGRARFVPIETEPEGDDQTETTRRVVVEGTADGGKGRQEPDLAPSGPNTEMNRIIRREAFIDDARRIRQRGW